MAMLDLVKRGDFRLRCLAAVILAGFFILFSGLWYVQVVSRTKYQTSLKSQSFRNVRMPASRGRILDRNGQVLVDNQARFNVNLYLDDIREQFKYEYTNSVRKAFVAQFGRKPKRAEWLKLEELARYRVASNIAWRVSSAVLTQGMVLNPAAFAKHYREQLAMPLPIVKDLTSEQIAAFMVKGANLPGVELEVEPVRSYPHGSLAAHALGYVQQELQPEDDEAFLFRYRLPDYVGKTGIENGFDEDLRGRAGAKAILVNNIGYRQSEETWLPPIPGKNVVLTLDLQLQRAAEKALLASGKDTRGAAVVLHCRTGDILAMASVPAYDLNMFVNSRDYTEEDWARLNDETLTPQYNRVLQGAYHPGSIFKIIVALAGFEGGIMDLDDKIHNAGVYMVGRRSIRDKNAPVGDYAFVDAFKRSANSYFIDVGLRTGAERLIEMGSRFNLGERTGLVPSKFEYRGYFPAVGDRLKADGSRWMDGDTANLSIGQGEVTVTPMQMALMTAAVANGGKLMKPRLVVKLEDQEENGLIEAMPAPQVERDITVNPRHLEWVRRAMLADVEEEYGTGRAAFIPGMAICGKTGTAQVRKAKGMDDITWFVSFAPFDAPKYAVVVMVESGGSGGGTCAPIAKEIYKAIQQMEQDRLKNMAAIE